MNLEERIKSLEDRVRALEGSKPEAGMEDILKNLFGPKDAASSIRADAERIKALRKK